MSPFTKWVTDLSRSAVFTLCNIPTTINTALFTKRNMNRFCSTPLIQLCVLGLLIDICDRTTVCLSSRKQNHVLFCSAKQPVKFQRVIKGQSSVSLMEIRTDIKEKSAPSKIIFNRGANSNVELRHSHLETLQRFRMKLKINVFVQSSKTS